MTEERILWLLCSLKSSFIKSRNSSKRNKKNAQWRQTRQSTFLISRCQYSEANTSPVLRRILQTAIWNSKSPELAILVNIEQCANIVQPWTMQPTSWNVGPTQLTWPNVAPTLTTLPNVGPTLPTLGQRCQCYWCPKDANVSQCWSTLPTLPNVGQRYQRYPMLAQRC